MRRGVGSRFWGRYEMGPNRTREWDYVTGSAESGGLTFLPSEVLKIGAPWYIF